jgi:nucleotide-binding universal stress UspA family protein
MTISRILVPVDYSDCSGAALAFAAGIASVTGAELDVVHVWDRPAYVSDAVRVVQQGVAVSLVDLIRDNAETEMGDFLAKVTIPPGVRLSHRLLSGNPAQRILTELRLHQHQLLVVGTHGRTGVRHLLLGSVAETLVRLSPVPTLTVPATGRG